MQKITGIFVHCTLSRNLDFIFKNQANFGVFATLSSLGQDYSVFPTINPTRKGYANQRPGKWGCPMSSLDEEFVTMIGGLAAFAAFCIAALLLL
jgi:hypothetical protein